MKWIMLIYKLPKSKTTAIKVSVWRKLKKLGVYSLQDSVCVLPYTERTLEKFEWLAEEIKELGGSATLWEVKGLSSLQEEEINEFFLEQVNEQYRQIIKTAQNTGDINQIKELWSLFNRVKAQDYLKSPLWIQVKGILESKARELLPDEEDRKK